MPCQFVGLQGPDAGRVFALNQSATMIGRDSASSIALPHDSKVSRRHARIILTSSGWIIEDLASSNGTFVNGVRIQGSAALNEGDIVQIGGNRFRFDSLHPSGTLTLRSSEIGFSERRALAPGGSNRSGCLVPTFVMPDASGCSRILKLLLAVLAAMAVTGGILMLVGTGIGALSGIGRARSSTPNDSSDGSSSGGTPGAESSRGAIHIVMASLTRQGRVVVTWRNATGQPVHAVWANVQLLDSRGFVLVQYTDVRIYDGSTVIDGQIHEDHSVVGEGFLPVNPPQAAASASVEPTRWR